MRDRELYARILGLQSPWRVSRVELALSVGEVTVQVKPEPGASQCGPTGGKISPGYDSRPRRWRHLDTCQYQTILGAEVPRGQCQEHGGVTVSVPGAEPGSGYTARFEALVIDWLKAASTAAVSRQLKLSWNAIDGIMQRAVKRGLARREEARPTPIGVDETAFRKRHDYVTIVSNQENGTVLHVGDDRQQETLKAWDESLTEAPRVAIESVSMDLWPAFIHAPRESLPGAEEKLAFDQFQVAKYLGAAVDKGCRQEHKALMAEGREDLKGSKYDWLHNPENLTRQPQQRFKALRDSRLKTARAWAIKELARSLWHDASRTWARQGWERWWSWAVRRRLEPRKAVARTIRKHLWGILNAVVLKVSNGPAEGLHSRIKMIKVRSRGFRSKKRFAKAIYFHLGGLDLYPEGVR